jgi:ribosomal protein L11 methyltransferase
MSPKGRPEGEYRSAQREGGPVHPKGRPKGECRSAQRAANPMTYVALRFDAAAADADAWSDALVDAGALSVDVSDPHAGTSLESPLYGEPGLSAPGAWPWSRVVALFAADADWRALLAAAAHGLAVPVPPHETYPVAEQDWVRNTQAQFGPIEIAPGFWVVPSWSDVPVASAVTLRLDPGLAFGTGSHPTTQLCLEWLRDALRGGEAVLDYGCGSGILAIAACKLSAGRAAGVDVDPQALQASADNALANGVAANFVPPDALPAGTFDVVVANILANPLILLAPVLATRVAAPGRIALSGILVDQAGGVAAAYAPWFKLAPWRERDGWVLLVGERGA